MNVLVATRKGVFPLDIEVWYPADREGMEVKNRIMTSIANGTMDYSESDGKTPKVLNKIDHPYLVELPVIIHQIIICHDKEEK